MSDTFGRHVVQYPGEYSVCLGCKSCEVVCSLVHDGATGTQLNRIWCGTDSVRHLYHTIHSCQHCLEHPCYEACPKKDAAMCIDPDTGIVYVVEQECIGCGKCQRSCVFTPSRINLVRGKDKARAEQVAKKCDLCRGRAGGPACIEACPAMCLGLSDAPLPYVADELPTFEKVGA